jgi:hypothetical protein
LNDAEPVLPSWSVAEQVTLVDPIANVEPEAGVQVGVREPSRRSVAETENVTAAPFFEVAFTVMSAGTVTTGAILF